MKYFYLLFALAPLFAGAPIGRDNNENPIPQDNSVPFVYNIEAGDLNVFFDNSLSSGLVRSMFSQWNNVSGSTLVIQEGPQIESDITSVDQMDAAVKAGLSPIIFDEFGSIFEELGTSASVLAFAGPKNFSNGKYHQMVAVFGGPANVSQNLTEVSSTILHELGHGLGLGHSVVNGDSGVNHPYGAPAKASYEVMYWLARAANTSPLRDDLSGFLRLYGNTSQGTTGLGAIKGKVLMSDGITPADGIGIIVRDYSGQASTYYTNCGSDITTGADGTFEIVGLPPGSYSVQVYDIGRRNRGVYADPIRTNGTSNTSVILGPFPGAEELYSGPNENNNSETDLDDSSNPYLVQVGANQTVSDINIIFNRQAGILGSTLGEIYLLSEIQSGESTETFLHFVNPNSNAVNIEVYGFSLGGELVGKTSQLSSLPALGQAKLGVKDAFPDSYSNLSWVQVGASDNLHVFAEIETETTRASYMASHGMYADAIVPHVGKDTAKFETFVSSVNGNAESISTELVSTPSAAHVNLTNHGLKYAKTVNTFTNLFGTDLSGVDWVQVNSTGGGSASMEYFVTLPERNQMAALGVNNQKARRLRLLHIATDTNTFWTGMVYINVGQSADTATEVYYNQNGEVLKTATQALQPGQKITLLFDANNQEQVPPGSAWLEVSLPDNSVNDLVGYELYGASHPETLQSFAGLQGNFDAGPIVDYPVFETKAGSYNGIVLINLGDTASDVVMTAYDSNGMALETVNVPALAPKTKLVRLLNTGATPLFSDANTYANAAWVRASSSNGLMAGFMIYGDSKTGGDRLCGIEAISLGTLSSSALIIPEMAGSHNSYETAQVLTPSNGIWNLNVVGTISQDGGAGPIVNTCEGCNDGMEDLYSFTLSEPTRLLIATAPTSINADIDLFVVKGQQASQDFFAGNNGFTENIEFSGRGGGLESIARVFEPGTYYILVSLFEGDNTKSIGYGLLVSQQPLLLETFDDASALDNWSFFSIASDSDGQSNWDYSNGFGTSKYGGVLAQTTPSSGIETTGVFTPMLSLPDSGLVIFDFDAGALVGSSFQPNNGLSIYIQTESGVPYINGYTWSSTADQTDLSYNGTAFNFIGWSRYAGSEITTADFTIPQGTYGTEVKLGLLGTSSDAINVIDNVRVYQVISSLTDKREPLKVSVQGLKPKRKFKNPIPELLRAPAN